MDFALLALLIFHILFCSVLLNLNIFSRRMLLKQNWFFLTRHLQFYFRFLLSSSSSTNSSSSSSVIFTDSDFKKIGTDRNINFTYPGTWALLFPGFIPHRKRKIIIHFTIYNHNSMMYRFNCFLYIHLIR